MKILDFLEMQKTAEVNFNQLAKNIGNIVAKRAKEGHMLEDFAKHRALTVKETNRLAHLGRMGEQFGTTIPAMAEQHAKDVVHAYGHGGLHPNAYTSEGLAKSEAAASAQKDKFHTAHSKFWNNVFLGLNKAREEGSTSNAVMGGLNREMLKNTSDAYAHNSLTSMGSMPGSHVPANQFVGDFMRNKMNEGIEKVIKRKS